MSDRAADCSAITNLRMRDVTNRLVQQGYALKDLRRGLDRRLPRERADP